MMWREKHQDVYNVCVYNVQVSCDQGKKHTLCEDPVIGFFFSPIDASAV